MTQVSQKLLGSLQDPEAEKLLQKQQREVLLPPTPVEKRHAALEVTQWAGGMLEQRDNHCAHAPTRGAREQC
jgi:AICAR transformylase/IMP cyclohydrolase PurH